MQGLVLATVCWSVIAVAALIWEPNWPQARPLYVFADGQFKMVGHVSTFEAWRGQGVTLLISYFLFLKSWLMFRRSRFYDRLGISVIAVNVCFALVYELTLAWALWPVLQQYRWGREIVIYTLLMVILWSSFELMLTDDEEVL